MKVLKEIRIDLYTRVILTIIAICMSYSVLKEMQIITPARGACSQIDDDARYAPAAPLPDGTVNVNITHVNGAKVGSSVPIDISRQSNNYISVKDY